MQPWLVHVLGVLFLFRAIDMSWVRISYIIYISVSPRPGLVTNSHQSHLQKDELTTKYFIWLRANSSNSLRLIIVRGSLYTGVSCERVTWTERPYFAPFYVFFSFLRNKIYSVSVYCACFVLTYCNGSIVVLQYGAPKGTWWEKKLETFYVRT